MDIELAKDGDRDKIGAGGLFIYSKNHKFSNKGIIIGI